MSEHIPGNVWVRPMGGKYDEGYTATATTIRVLNLHLTASVFTQLGDYYGLPVALARSVLGIAHVVIDQVKPGASLRSNEQRCDVRLA